MTPNIPHIDTYIRESIAILQQFDRAAIDRLVMALEGIRSSGGRLFFLGNGGGAAMSSHAAADIRTVAGIEAYAASDTAVEWTARANDAGWATAMSAWLEASRLGRRDAVFIFSVGGGCARTGVSANLVHAVETARRCQALVLGVIGRSDGVTAQLADACVIVPDVESRRLTAHTEGMQALIWHLLISDPRLQQRPMKWESLR